MISRRQNGGTESAYSTCNVVGTEKWLNDTETAQKICSFYGQGVITDRQIRNWFLKFCYGDRSLRNEPRWRRSSGLDQDH